MLEKLSSKNHIAFFVLLSIYVIFAIRFSPVFEQIGYDKEVFQYIGMLIKNHLAPYTNAFDNKPPIIYLINYMGVLLTPNSTWGVFIILNSLGFFSAWLIYKLALNELKTSLIPLLIGISFIVIMNSNYLVEGGNMTRQLVAFLTTFILYIVFTFKKTAIKNAIIGFIIGIIFFTQQNEVLGGLVLSGYYLMFESDFNFQTKRNIIKNSAFFFLGLLISFLGVLLIIQHWNNYNDFINQVFLFNFSQYIEHKSFLTKIALVIFKLLKVIIINKILLVISIVILVNLWIQKRDILLPINSKWIVVFVAFMFQILSTSISGKDYNHYFLMFIPYFICFLIFSIDIKNPCYNKFFIAIWLLALGFHSIKNISYQKPDNSLLNSITNEVKSVKNMNGQFYTLDASYLRVNFNLNIIAPSKHIYIHYSNEEFAKTVSKDLQKNNTKYVLFKIEDEEFIPQVLKSFITSNYKEKIIHKGHILFERL